MASEPCEHKPGDQVMLPSGGPGMTVIDIGQHSGLVWCRWIDKSGAVCEGYFPPSVLRDDPRCHLQGP